MFEKYWSNFDKENFTFEYFSIDKDKVLEIDQEKIDYST